MNIVAIIKNSILYVANRLGYDIIAKAKNIRIIPPEPLATLISHYSIDTVIDVGANEGQFALNLRASGFKGLIISLEPASQAFEKLQLAAIAGQPWETHQCAAGNEDGTVEINIASNSYSSSILAMCPKHEEAAPTSRYVGKETVPIRTLDSLLGPRLATLGRILLKIDVQGYEHQVLLGANEIIKRAVGIFTEASIVQLYEGSIGLQELLHFMSERKFLLHHVERVFWHEKTQQLLQMDCAFFKEPTGTI